MPIYNFEAYARRVKLPGFEEPDMAEQDSTSIPSRGILQSQPPSQSQSYLAQERPDQPMYLSPSIRERDQIPPDQQTRPSALGFALESAGAAATSAIASTARAARDFSRVLPFVGQQDPTKSNIFETVLIDNPERALQMYLDKYAQEGMKTKPFAESAVSIGYSGSTMIPALAAGAAGLMASGGNPLVAQGLGGLAAGMTAYGSTRDAALDNWFRIANDELMQRRGSPLTKEEWDGIVERSDLLGKARGYGAWEAVPEAIADVVGFRILKGMTVIPGVKGVAKKVTTALGSGVLGKLATYAGRGAGTQVSENIQELITGMKQQGIENELGLAPEPVMSEVFAAQLPSVAITTAALGGLGLAGRKSMNMMTKYNINRKVEDTRQNAYIKSSKLVDGLLNPLSKNPLTIEQAEHVADMYSGKPIINEYMREIIRQKKAYDELKQADPNRADEYANFARIRHDFFGEMTKPEGKQDYSALVNAAMANNKAGRIPFRAAGQFIPKFMEAMDAAEAEEQAKLDEINKRLTEEARKRAGENIEEEDIGTMVMSAKGIDIIDKHLKTKKDDENYQGYTRDYVEFVNGNAPEGFDPNDDVRVSKRVAKNIQKYVDGVFQKYHERVEDAGSVEEGVAEEGAVVEDVVTEPVPESQIVSTVTTPDETTVTPPAAATTPSDQDSDTVAAVKFGNEKGTPPVRITQAIQKIMGAGEKIPYATAAAEVIRIARENNLENVLANTDFVRKYEKVPGEKATATSAATTTPVTPGTKKQVPIKPAKGAKDAAVVAKEVPPSSPPVVNPPQKKAEQSKPSKPPVSKPSPQKKSEPVVAPKDELKNMDENEILEHGYSLKQDAEHLDLTNKIFTLEADKKKIALKSDYKKILNDYDTAIIKRFNDSILRENNPETLLRAIDEILLERKKEQGNKQSESLTKQKSGPVRAREYLQSNTGTQPWDITDDNEFKKLMDSQGAGFTFKPEDMSGEMAIHELNRFPKYEAQRKWAAQQAIELGLDVPDNVREKYGLAKKKDAATTTTPSEPVAQKKQYTRQEIDAATKRVDNIVGVDQIAVLFSEGKTRDEVVDELAKNKGVNKNIKLGRLSREDIEVAVGAMDASDQKITPIKAEVEPSSAGTPDPLLPNEIIPDNPNPISDPEKRAIDLAMDKAALKKRIMGGIAAEGMTARFGKNPKFDYQNKRIISEDGTLVAQWKVRKDPSKPVDMRLGKDSKNSQDPAGIVMTMDMGGRVRSKPKQTIRKYVPVKPAAEEKPAHKPTVDVDEMARLVKERDHVGNKIRAMIPMSQRDKLNPLAHETKVKSAVKEDSGKDKSTMAKLNDLYDQVHALNKQIDEVKKGKPEDKGPGPKGGGSGGGVVAESARTGQTGTGKQVPIKRGKSSGPKNLQKIIGGESSPLPSPDLDAIESEIISDIKMKSLDTEARQAKLDMMISGMTEKEKKANGEIVLAEPTKPIHKLISIIGRLFGSNPIFIAAKSGKSLTFGGVTHNQTGDIFIDVNVPLSMTYVMGHELGHKLFKDNPTLYRKLIDILEYEYGEEFEKWRVEYEKSLTEPEHLEYWNGLSRAQKMHEYINDTIGDRMSQPEFYRKLRSYSPSTLERIYNYLIDFIQKLMHYFKTDQVFADNKLSDIQKMYDAIDSVMFEYHKQMTGGKELDKVSRKMPEVPTLNDMFTRWLDTENITTAASVAATEHNLNGMGIKVINTVYELPTYLQEYYKNYDRNTAANVSAIYDPYLSTVHLIAGNMQTGWEIDEAIRWAANLNNKVDGIRMQMNMGEQGVSFKNVFAMDGKLIKTGLKFFGNMEKVPGKMINLEQLPLKNISNFERDFIQSIADPFIQNGQKVVSKDEFMNAIKNSIVPIEIKMGERSFGQIKTVGNQGKPEDFGVSFARRYMFDTPINFGQHAHSGITSKTAAGWFEAGALDADPKTLVVFEVQPSDAVKELFDTEEPEDIADEDYAAYEAEWQNDRLLGIDKQKEEAANKIRKNKYYASLRSAAQSGINRYFYRSIIQWAAKNGYERVRFPVGESVAEIEGVELQTEPELRSYVPDKVIDTLILSPKEMADVQEDHAHLQRYLNTKKDGRYQYTEEGPGWFNIALRGPDGMFYIAEPIDNGFAIKSIRTEYERPVVLNGTVQLANNLAARMEKEYRGRVRRIDASADKSGFVTDKYTVTDEMWEDWKKEGVPPKHPFLEVSLRPEDATTPAMFFKNIPDYLASDAHKKYTDSPAFRKWQDGSVVTDVMYHATVSDINIFSPWTHFGTMDAAVERLDVKFRVKQSGLIVKGKKNELMGQNMMPVYLSIKNPYRVSDAQANSIFEIITKMRQDKINGAESLPINFVTVFDAHNKIMKVLQDAGYDGIVYENKFEDKGKDSYIIFRSTQVKSAISNNGNWSATDGRISFKLNTPADPNSGRSQSDPDALFKAVMEAAEREQSKPSESQNPSIIEQMNRVSASHEYFNKREDARDFSDIKAEIIRHLPPGKVKDMLVREPGITEDEPKFPKASKLETHLMSPEYYLAHSPHIADRTIFGAAMDRDDTFRELLNVNILESMRKDGKDVNLMTVIDDLEKKSKQEYDKVGRFVIESDMNQNKYASGGRVDEAKLKAAGISRDGIQAIKSIRRILDNALDIMIQELKNKYDDAMTYGSDNPHMVEYRDDRQTTYNIANRIKALEELKGWYFPRIRESGNIPVTAKKTHTVTIDEVEIEVNDMQPQLKFANNKFQANAVANVFKRMGYDNVHIGDESNPPERMINTYTSIMTIQQFFDSISERMERAAKKEAIKKIDEIEDIEIDYNHIYTRKTDGKKERHVTIKVKGEYKKKYAKEFLMADGKPYDDGLWHFKPSRSLNRQLINAFNTASMEEFRSIKRHFEAQFLIHETEVLSQNTYRSTMIRRGKEVGIDVWGSYETDMRKALNAYTRKIAAGIAKSRMAGTMISALNGTMNLDLLPENADFDMMKEERDRTKIDHAHDSVRYERAKRYIMSQLASATNVDRAFSLIRSAVAVKYLGLAVASGGVNLTSLVTSTVATLRTHLGMNLTEAPGYIARALTEYIAYRKNPDEVRKRHPLLVKMFDEMRNKDWDRSQMNDEAGLTLLSKWAKIWNQAVKMSMFVMRKTEEVNRIGTLGASMLYIEDKIDAGYTPDVTTKERILDLETMRMEREEDPFKPIVFRKRPGGVNKLDYMRENSSAFYDISRVCKMVSDRANGVYGNISNPYVFQGEGALRKLASTQVMFFKFAHTYLMNMYEAGFKFKDRKALLYMLVAPTILGGVGASPLYFALKPVISQIAKWITGDDDPEEEFYNWMYKNTGETGEDFMRDGLFGAFTPVTIRNSISIQIPSLTSGIPASIIRDTSEAIEYIRNDNYWRAGEKLFPRVASNYLKSVREVKEGVTSPGGTPVRLGADQIRRTSGEALISTLGFNPVHYNRQRELAYKDRRLETAYQKRRDRLYDKYRMLTNRPRDEWDPGDFESFYREVQDYNERVIRNGVVGIKPVTLRDLKNAITNKPSRFQSRRSQRELMKRGNIRE